MSTFLTFIKFLPELIELVKYLSKKIDQGVDEAKIRASLKQIDGALDKAISSKDTSDLEDIFRGRKP